MKDILTILILSFLLVYCSNPKQGRYIDGNPPDAIPKIFAPGVISLPDRLEQNLTISKDGNEYYFGITDSQWDYTGILSVKIVKGKIRYDTVVSYTDLNHCGEPFLSRDGKRLMLVGNYPFNIWESKRKEDTWSSPVKLDPPVNTDFIEVHPSMAENGTLYFASTREDVSREVGEGAIYSAELVNGQYPEVKKLKGGINSGDAGDPAVSADESFIVFGSFKVGGYGETDLYISFRLADGNWSEPKNLGKNINTTAHEVGPFLSHDGKYLFFHRRERWKDPAYSDIYWVSTDFFFQLK